MVGIVADSPSQPIELMAFHATLQLDEATLAKEQQMMQPMPVIREVTQKEIRNTYLLIQQDIQEIVEQVLEQILNDPPITGAFDRTEKLIE